MSRFRSTKRAKELNRKAKHAAKEARKRERREKTESGETDDDIDWSQAVGLTAPEGTEPSLESEADAEDDDGLADSEPDPPSS
jgi:hypothetical protein